MIWWAVASAVVLGAAVAYPVWQWRQGRKPHTLDVPLTRRHRD